MRRNLLVAVAVAVPVFLVGCNQPEVKFTPLAVRFVVPPLPAEIDVIGLETEAQLTSDGVYSEVAMTHVSLWGGPFHGSDVTYGTTELEPGNYTFGFWDQAGAHAYKGWMQVNGTGSGLLDTLRRWKGAIPQQKEWLAYEHEVKGKLSTADAAVFKSFARQLRALDHLERQIDRAIGRELKMQARVQERRQNFLAQSALLVFSSDEEFFQPTTFPAFDVDDLQRVRNGEVMSKLLLLADYENAVWKLKLVDGLCRDLTACKAVMEEEVDRLERRKRYYTITDQIYNHDRKFVENEMHMQQTLAAIDRLEGQISEMRDRRLGLAFTAELIDPTAVTSALEEEERDLADERTVYEAKKGRLDKLFNESDENGMRRVAIARHRSRFIRSIDRLNRQLDMLTEARVALHKMQGNTDVLHRQGDFRLLAATFADDSVPFRVRESIARESLMTIRLQGSEFRFGPGRTQAMKASFRSEGQWETVVDDGDYRDSSNNNNQ